MKIDEILQLVDAVSKSTLTEFKYEEGAVKLSLKKTIKTVPAEAAPEPVLTIQAPAAPNQPASSPANPAPAAAAAPDPAGEETVSAPAARGQNSKITFSRYILCGTVRRCRPLRKYRGQCKRGPGIGNRRGHEVNE